MAASVRREARRGIGAPPVPARADAQMPTGRRLETPARRGLVTAVSPAAHGLRMKWNHLVWPASLVFGMSPFLLASATAARFFLRSAERVVCVPEAAVAAGSADASLPAGMSPFLLAAAMAARFFLRSAERVACVPEAGVAAGPGDASAE